MTILNLLASVIPINSSSIGFRKSFQLEGVFARQGCPGRATFLLSTGLLFDILKTLY